MMERLETLFQNRDYAAAREYLTAHPELVNARPQSAPSVLLLAAYHRQPDLVALILGTQPTLSLFEACALDRQRVVREHLARAPAAVDSFASDGFTPLGLAAFFDHPDLVELLLELGADVNLAAQNAARVAPIHSAVAVGSLPVTEILIEHEANVNVTQMQGVTALHSAARNGREDLVVALLNAGADPGAKMADGNTPVDLAQAQGHAAVVERLRGR